MSASGLVWGSLPSPHLPRLARLDTLSPIARNDTNDIAKWFPAGASGHTGRMRGALVRELIQRYAIPPNDAFVLADPLAGTGLTAVVGALMGVKRFVGAEYVRRWHRVAVKALEKVKFECGSRFEYSVFQQDAGKAPIRDRRISMIVCSPPFPNAHTQGKSRMQRALKDSKSTYAGNDFECGRRWGCGSNPRPRVWMGELERTLRRWVERCDKGAPILVHIKNFVRGGELIRVDQWAAVALSALDGVRVIGYHCVPLSYRSGFREWGRLPLQKVVSRRALSGERGWIEKLACGHTKTREPMDPAALPRSARCATCGPVEGHVEVLEERIVVARRL